MLVEAAAPLLLAGRLSLEIIGFGPELEPLEQLVARLGLVGRVTFGGKISHHDVAARFGAADLLTFPSVHEFGGAVVLEAMAMGAVPIVVDYGGPAELVTPACGYLLPMGDRAAVVASLRATLEEILRSPESLAPLSAQARHRARTLFAWSAKARQTLEVYRWVLGRRAEKPSSAMPFPDMPVSDVAEAPA